MPISEEELMRELMETFHAEADEHLQNLNQALLQLERRPDETRRLELLREAFRAAHSLKGAARSVSLGEVEQLSHALESVLQNARDVNMVLDADTCDVLYDTLDAIGKLLHDKPVELEPLHTRLTAIAEAEEPPPQEPEPPPSAPENSAPNDVLAPPAGMEAQTIRVAVQKLDDLMAQTGELLTSKISAEQRLVEMQAIHAQLEQWPQTWRHIKSLLSRLENGSDADTGRQLIDILEAHHNYLQTLTRDFHQLQQDIGSDTMRLGMVTGELQDEVRRVRMVPFRTLSLGLQRSVRDVARDEGKQMRLVIEGDDVELDKKVLESLKDPLIHLLNNAVSHGIEPPEARQAAGKPTEGQVTLSIQQRGGEVHITVDDDGRGFDLSALRQASSRRGGPDLGDDAPTEQVIGLAFLPGVSTVEQVTPMAGRGVGLDVVRGRLSEIQGRIRVESEQGKGAAIRLMVPASLTMTRGLLVQTGRERYILPLLSIEKIKQPEDIFAVEGRYMLPVDGKTLPLTSLAAALDRPNGSKKPSEDMTAIVVGVAEQRLALLVDDVLDELELAVKPLGKPLSSIPNVSGAALLGNGEPVVILNVTDLVHSARRMVPHMEAEEKKSRPDAHILVVDDSITTRTLEKNILEAAGYYVITATDGVEALKRLEANPIDIIVADVEMPNMDGIEFTRRVRESSSYRDMPVILVTSLESREDRERGMLAGADAYIVKRGFDQAELLATIEQFL